MKEADARKRLTEERAALLAESAAAEAERRPVELDQQSVGRLSRMDAMQVQAMAQATEQRRQLRLRVIDAALARLDAGTWGECVRCGEEIEPRRLALDLAAPLCADCAAAARP